MKKKWIWLISILLTGGIIATLAAVYLPVWQQVLYEKKIESYYTLSGDEKNAANHYAEDVSIIELIANPEKYDSKLVRVIGVGNLEFEGNYICLSKEDWEQSGSNQIWIELGTRATPYQEAQAYNGKYVIVEGFFDKDNCGHFGIFHGAITKVSRYELWEREDQQINESPSDPGENTTAE